MPDRDVRDVPLIDLDHQTVTVERRDFEQYFPLLDRSAQLLAEIADHNDPVERCEDFGMRKLVVEQSDLRLSLVHLRGHDLHFGRFPLSHRLVIFLLVLFKLAQRLQPLQPQLPVIQRAQHLAGLHQIAGPHRRFANISVERRRSGALDDRLQHRFG